MKKYQGEDIYFSLKFNSSENPDISNFNDLSNIVVYAYTDELSPVKFSRETKVGYEPLLVISNTEIKGVVKSSFTKEMTGQMIFDVLCETPSPGEGDSIETLIKKVFTGIFISPNIIKSEVE